MKKVLSILLTLILVLSVSFDCQAADISWSNDYVATANSSRSVVVPLTAYYTFYLQGGVMAVVALVEQLSGQRS